MVKGLPYGEVEVVASEPHWETEAAASIVDLRAALARSAIAIEHVGSTAVPGLPAKPIIDLAVALQPSARMDRVVTSMEVLAPHSASRSAWTDRMRKQPIGRAGGPCRCS